LGFWVGVFGFKHLYTTTFPNNPFIENVVGVSGAALRLAMLEAPGHFIELLEYSAPDSRTTMKPRSCDVGSVHVAFEVDDLDGILERTKRWDGILPGPHRPWKKVIELAFGLRMSAGRMA
jgi:hypothetical protein